MMERSKWQTSPLTARDHILDSLHVGVVVHSPDATIQYANEAAPRLLGLSMDQLLGRTSFDPRWNAIRTDGAPFPGPEHPAPQAIAIGEPILGVVMGVHRPDRNDRVWLLVDAIPYKDEHGIVEYAVATFMDISDRRQLEQALQQANARLEQEVSEQTEALRASVEELSRQTELYRSVFEANAAGIVVHSASGEIVDANTRAEVVLGLSLEQLRGRISSDPRWRLEELDGSPLDPETVPSQVSQREGVPVRRRLLAVHRPNGERAVISVNSQPVFEDGNPHPVTVVVTFEDITSAHAVQQALHASNQRFQRIAETIPGLFFELHWESGAPLCLSYANEGARQYFGLAHDADFTAAALVARIHPDHREDAHALIQRLRDGQTSGNLQLRLSDGRWFHLRAQAAHEGTFGRLSLLLLDVDQEVRIAHAAREAQKRQAVGELVSGVAHNFNNMLAAILPNLKDAIERAGDDLRPQLEDAAVAATSAADLVRQLLLVAQNDADGAHALLDLSAVADEAISIARRTFDRRIAIHTDLPDGPATVFGRASQLQNVALNLMLNARDAMQGVDAPELSVRIVRAEIDGASAWSLVVQDNGAGMSAQTLARIGEPFFTTKGAGRGTGLGIATAVRIAQDHDGRLRWSSILGSGSRFTLTLPAAQGETQPAAKADEQTRAWMRGTVLLVDDERLVRRALARQLVRAGLDLIEAEDGEEALRLLEAHRERIDVVLLDLSMPGLSGPPLLARIDALVPTVPVVILSGHLHADVDLSRACRLLTKPPDRDELLAALDLALNGGASHKT